MDDEATCSLAYASNFTIQPSILIYLWSPVQHDDFAESLSVLLLNLICSVLTSFPAVLATHLTFVPLCDIPYAYLLFVFISSYCFKALFHGITFAFTLGPPHRLPHLFYLLKQLFFWGGRSFYSNFNIHYFFYNFRLLVIYQRSIFSVLCIWVLTVPLIHSHLLLLLSTPEHPFSLYLAQILLCAGFILLFSGGRGVVLTVYYSSLTLFIYNLSIYHSFQPCLNTLSCLFLPLKLLDRRFYLCLSTFYSSLTPSWLLNPFTYYLTLFISFTFNLPLK